MALLVEQGIELPAIYFTRSADMRYVGQEYSVDVLVGAEVDLATLEQTFHEAHHVRYGHATPTAPTEFVNLRVAAMGRIDADLIAYQPPDSTAAPSAHRRDVVFDGAVLATPVVLRSRLHPGDSFEGALIVEDETATTVVPPGSVTSVDDFGNLIITTS